MRFTITTTKYITDEETEEDELLERFSTKEEAIAQADKLHEADARVHASVTDTEEWTEVYNTEWD